MQHSFQLPTSSRSSDTIRNFLEPSPITERNSPSCKKSNVSTAEHPSPTETNEPVSVSLQTPGCVLHRGPTRCCGHTCQHADTHTPQTCPGVSKADCAQRGPTLPCTQRAHDCLTTRHSKCPAPVSPQGWLRHTVVSSRGGVATVPLPHYSQGGPGTVPRAAASRESSPRFCSSMVQVSTPSDMDGRRDALSSVVAVQRLSSHPRPPPSTGVLTTTSVTAWTLISPPAVNRTRHLGMTHRWLSLC